MNEYTISMTQGTEIDALTTRTEVAETPDQAMWQAFGVMVQDSRAYVITSAKLLQSEDRHFNSVMGGTLMVEVKHRHGCRQDDTILFTVVSIEMDKSERDCSALPPITVNRDSFIVVEEREQWGESPHGSGKMKLSNGMTFGWAFTSGDGEIQGYVTKANGQFITPLGGWYRTNDPEVAVDQAIHRLKNESFS